MGFLKWHDLNDYEISQINSGISHNSITKYYKKCELDPLRFDLWAFINRFDDDTLSNLQRSELISKIDMTKAKSALRYFISAVYSNVGFDLESFIKVFKECEEDLKVQGLSLHEYGLIKVCGKFVDTERKLFKQNTNESNDYKIAVEENITDIYNLFSNLKQKNKNDDYYTLKSTLNILHNIHKGIY